MNLTFEQRKEILKIFKGGNFNMRLYDFINELKHNGLSIDIFYQNKCVFTGSVSTFKNWIHNHHYYELRVIKIEPLSKSLDIFL